MHHLLRPSPPLSKHRWWERKEKKKEEEEKNGRKEEEKKGKKKKMRKLPMNFGNLFWLKQILRIPLGVNEFLRSIFMSDWSK